MRYAQDDDENICQKIFSCAENVGVYVAVLKNSIYITDKRFTIINACVLPS